MACRVVETYFISVTVLALSDTCLHVHIAVVNVNVIVILVKVDGNGSQGRHVTNRKGTVYSLKAQSYAAPDPCWDGSCSFKVAIAPRHEDIEHPGAQVGTDRYL